MAAVSDWSVRSWQIPDGSNNQVTSIAQSPDGYLWIGTSAGLSQFDGDHFHNQRLGPLAGLTHSRIRAMLRTRDGALWTALDGAVVVLRLSQAPTIIKHDVPGDHALSMEEDDQGAVWISYFSGAILKITKEGAVNHGADAGLPPGPGRTSLAADSAGRIWILKDSLVGFLRNGKFSEVFQSPRLNAIGPARDGGMWICSGFHLYKYTVGKGLASIADLPFNRANGEAMQLLEDEHGLWIGTTTGGLLRFDNQDSFERIPTPQVHITSLYKDHEGDLWAGTDAGLDRISVRVVRLESAESGLPLGGVTSLCQAPDGRTWAVAADGTLMTEEAGHWQRAAFWKHDFASCVTTDRAGALWIGTRNQRLYRWQSEHLSSWGTKEGLEPHSITAILASSNGILWMGSTTADKLQCFRGGRFADVPIPQGNGQVCALVEDRAGKIWIGRTGTGGLFCLADGKLSSIPLPNAYNPVHALCVGADDTLWAGCYTEGLARVKGGKLTMITAAQGLYDDHISQIISDGHGWLWFGSDHGIFRIEEKQLNAVADGKTSHVQSILYGGDEGLPSLQARYGICPNTLVDSDGHLFMTMATSLASISPGRVSDQIPPPQLQIERVLVDDRVIAAYGGLVPNVSSFDLSRDSGLQFGSNYRRLEIDFTALSFLAPSNVHFEYKLPGIDDHWMAGDPERRVVYPRLPPGQYQFLVRACNSNGVWNEQGASLAFVVTPALWQRWWFAPAVILLFTALLAALVRYISLRRVQARLNRLEYESAVARERARIARDLHDDLGARLTNLIMLAERNCRESNQRGATDGLVVRLASGVRQAIKSLDETVWAVNPRNDTLPHMINYIGQSSVDYLRAANIRCRVRLLEHSPDREVSSEIRHNVLLVVKEALNNIVRHSNATEVTIGVSLEQEMICLTIQDNGQGISDAPGDSYADGLGNMRQRMEEIGGRFEIASEAGAGTRIALHFPWSRRTGQNGTVQRQR